MLINSFERDARNDGWKAGIKEGMQQGIDQGFAHGVMQTAKNLLKIGLSVENIAEATGLSREEIEKL